MILTLLRELRSSQGRYANTPLARAHRPVASTGVGQ